MLILHVDLRVIAGRDQFPVALEHAAVSSGAASSAARMVGAASSRMAGAIGSICSRPNAVKQLPQQCAERLRP